MVRENLICFVADDDEKKVIRENAETRKMSMSAFIRDRTVRSEMTNNELADFLMNYIARMGVKTAGISIGRKILKPPPEIMIETAGMTEEQKKKFVEYERRKREARGELVKELEECLKTKGTLEQCNIEILEE